MAVVKIYDQNKQESGECTLSPEIFEVAVRPEILNLVVRAQRASWRAGTHSTLNRKNMEGGGAKPWRQKGTGRARSGSNNSPIWRGGAITFGPHPRDYGFKVNRKVRRLALKMALSSRLAAERLMVVNSIDLAEAKTKDFVKVATNLGLKKALLISNENHNLALASRNIKGVTVLTPEALNVYDILKHPQLVILSDALESVQTRLK